MKKQSEHNNMNDYFFKTLGFEATLESFEHRHSLKIKGQNEFQTVGKRRKNVCQISPK